jgi:hypothetical protein
LIWRKKWKWYKEPLFIIAKLMNYPSRRINHSKKSTKEINRRRHYGRKIQGYDSSRKGIKTHDSFTTPSSTKEDKKI